MKRALILALLVAFVACANLVGAQTLTGVLSGKVTDEQGGVLPGVTVTLTGRTGAQTQVTDARGEYRFIGLNPGLYTVRAELQGFRPKEQQNVDVSANRTAEVGLMLQVGALAETVNVVANTLTVDTTTTATDTSLSQDLLFSMPVSHNNPAVNILNYMPGVNNGSAFGGQADYGNSLAIDGVDTRDPDAGSSWVFFNYNIIDEIQVGALGQTAEYGGFTGAVVNTITKSGGNKVSFLSELRFSNGGLGADSNASADVAKQNPNLAKALKYDLLSDYTVQIGGPIKKDKVFFFFSVQRYEFNRYSSSPTVLNGEVSPRYNGKITWQLTPNDTLMGSVQYDNYNQTGRLWWVPGYQVTDQSKQTIIQDSPEWVYNAQYRKVFGASTFLEAKFTGWWGYYDLNPTSFDPPHYDGETGLNWGGAGGIYQADRTRNQVNASLSQYAKWAGTHNFKFGLEIERSTVHSRQSYTGPNSTWFYDLGGEPYLAYSYAYDLKGTNKRESYYAQDQWKAGRFTANLGLRYDNIRGYSPVLSETIFKTKSVGPRLGFAVDITGKGTSVVRMFWGRMYESAAFSMYSRAVPGMADQVTYEVGPNWTSLTEIDRTSGASLYSMSDSINHPRVDEFNVSFEQQFKRTYKLTATFVDRRWGNFMNSVLIDGQWTPATATNYIGGTIPIYKWGNSSSIDEKYLIQNVDDIAYQLTNGNTLRPSVYRTYQGLMFILQRAYKDRWQAQASWVISQTRGTVPNTGAQDFWGRQFETPNTIVGMYDGPVGLNRTHEVKLFAGYQIPKIEVAVNGYWRYLSARPYAATRSYSGSTFNWVRSITLNLDNRGDSAPDPTTKKGVYQYFAASTQLDLRLEKVFNYGIHRFGVYADFQNLFNQGAVVGVASRYPTTSLTDYSGNDFTVNFGGPTTLQPAFQATFGVRWSF